MLRTQANALHHVHHLLLLFGLAQFAVYAQRLGQLKAYGVARIERCVWVLKHHLDFGAQVF